MHELSKKVINGVKCDITVDDEGTFMCRANGEWWKADTLAELLKTLKRETRKTKVEVAVPAMLMNVVPIFHIGRGTFRQGTRRGEPTCVPVTLIGIDWRNDEVKYRNPAGEIHTLGRGGHTFAESPYIGKLMSAEEVSEWQALRAAHVKADAAFRAYNDKFRLEFGEPEKLVRKAQAEKIDTPVEPDDDNDE